MMPAEAQFSEWAPLSLVLTFTRSSGLTRSKCWQIGWIVLTFCVRDRLTQRNRVTSYTQRNRNSMCFILRSPWERTTDRLTWLPVRTSAHKSCTSFSIRCLTNHVSSKPDPIAWSSASRDLNAGVACIRANEVITASFKATSPPLQ